MKKILQKNKIKIKLNDEKYSYDVYQMFNIYFQNLKIEFDNEGFDYEVEILQDEIRIKDSNSEWEKKVSSIIYKKDEIRKAIFCYLKERTQDRYPWGTLIGIRPSKIAMGLIREGKGSEEIVDFYMKGSYTEREKSELCIEIAKNEMSLIHDDDKKISIYIGMPYCPSKCVYCSFTSNPIPRKGDEVKRYIEALIYEMNILSSEIREKKLEIDTVYFGGGTPTAVNDEEFSKVMDAIYTEFVKDLHIREFTVECGRVDSINEKKLRIMKEKEVSRISINPQTMNDATLKRIGRTHNSEDIRVMFDLAREIGHDNINMDLIIGLPGEGIEEVKHTCEEIKRINPESVTVHGLSVKRGSVLYEKFITNEDIYVPNQEEIIMMFDSVKALSEELDMIPYYMYRQKNMLGNMENIGYSKKGNECIYNIAMIEDTQTIVAVGANGISKFLLEDGIIERVGNNKDVSTYMDKIEEITSEKIELLNRL